MRLRVCAPALALLAPSSSSAAQDSLRTSLRRFELPNGLQIVVAENHSTPVALVLVAVRGGASVQGPDERGLAHVLEHLLFRSYGYGSVAFGDATVDLDGVYNGTTSFESVNYFVLVPSERAIGGIELLGSLMRQENFRPRELKEERRIILDELERGESDPEAVLARRVSRELWGTTWHRRDVSGDSGSLMRITEAQLRAVHARYYVPNNAALVVTGNVRAGDVLDAARRAFGSWNRGTDSAAPRPPPLVALTGSRAVIIPRDVPDVTIRIALQVPGLAADGDATYAAVALVDLLNDPRAAFQERLIGSGRFQHLALSCDVTSGATEIAVTGKTTSAAAQQSLLALIQQIDSLEFLSGVTDEDLAIARRRREVEDVLAFEASATLAPSLADWWASGGLDDFPRVRERLDGQGLDGLRRFAGQYVARRPKVIGVLGPSDAMNALAEWLRASVREQ